MKHSLLILCALLVSSVSAISQTTPVRGTLTFTDDIRQTFNPGATNAGINVGSHAGNPSGPSNGDFWYNSSTGAMMARIAGSSVALGTASGTLTTISWTGGIVSIANPTTTPALTIAGTSGGIPYFNSGTTWATSGALGAGNLVIGGGAGSAPTSVTAGATTEILVGGGAGTAPVWTTATGTGAPVRAGSPTFTGIVTTASWTATTNALVKNNGGGQGGTLKLEDQDSTLVTKIRSGDITVDRTLLTTDVDGNIVSTGDTGTVTNTMLAGSIDLTTKVTGTLPVANGGTGATTFTDAGVLIGNTTGAVQVTTAGTAGQVLTSNGAGVDPTFQAAAGASKVVQIIYVSKTDTASTASTTFGAVMSGTITPTSASNKIIVLAVLACGSPGNSGYPYFLRLARSGTPLLQGDAAGSRVQTHVSGYFTGVLNAMHSVSLLASESPSSTSALTYDVEAKVGNAAATFYLNRTYNDSNVTDDNGRGASYMILMEVTP